MLRSKSKSLGNHVVSPEEEKERLQCEGFAEKKVLSLEWNRQWVMENHSVFLLPFCGKIKLCISITVSGISGVRSTVFQQESLQTFKMADRRGRNDLVKWQCSERHFNQIE